MTKNPSVSVVISTYNRSLLLKRAIESVIAQTYKDFEIIVIDDGSTDQTKDMIEAYKGRVSYFYQDNAGVSAARNHGIQKARGCWIALLDDDDQWLPNKLSIQVDKIKQLPQPGFLWCNGIRGGVSVRNPSYPSGFVKSMSVIFCQPSSWLMSREIFKSIGGFDISCKNGTEDVTFSVKALMNGIKIYYQNDSLVVWENTPGHLSADSPERLIYAEERLNLYSDYFKKDRLFFYNFLYVLGKDALRLGDKKRARKYILGAFWLQPWKLELLAKYFSAL